MMLLDAEPVVMEDANDTVECYWHTCHDDATWRTLWKCGCVHAYCAPHKQAITEARVECNAHNMVPIGPGIWERV